MKKGSKCGSAGKKFEAISGRKEEQKKRLTHGEEALRLARENAVMAEIGRIASSTLNFEEVYDRFTEEVRKLISFDSLAVKNVVIDKEKNFLGVSYVLGKTVTGNPGREPTPFAGSVTEEAVNTRSGIIIDFGDIEKVKSRYPRLVQLFGAGIRSMMVVPVIFKDRAIGTIHFRSKNLKNFSDHDLKVAVRISAQIAGDIANAQLFAERRQMEETLKESEARHRRLVESSNDIIMEVDENGNLLYVSPNYKYIAGYDPAERLGKSMFEYAHPDDIPAIVNTIEKAKQSGEGKVVCRNRHKDGRWLWYEASGKVYRTADGQLRSVVISRNIDERKQAEEKMASLQEQLRQSQKMEAIGSLAGGIAHDFNNLLTVINGYSQVSLIGMKEGDPLRENIKEIVAAGNRASELTRQLLAFSRRQILEFKVVDLNDLIKALQKMLRRVIGEDIELLVHLQEDLGRIKTDPAQLEQVILNLAVNSRTAMPSGGKLVIETDNVFLDEDYAQARVGVKPGHYVRLLVSDTGCGMTPEVKRRVFEPFFTTKEKGKGTGLGLSTAYGIVKQSGGNIWVYSEVGHGTTFKIYLPLLEVEAAPILRQEESASSLRGNETILLVEDEPSVRNLAAYVLRRTGYKVIEAEDGPEALDLIRNGKIGQIDLLLTDVIMPKMDGKELADQLRSSRPNIKVLFTSGYTDETISYHGILGPDIAFLQKPFTSPSLAKKVREVLNK
jgi:two-component system, cell cycle sensor histidine kinase and response regulator CckA